MNGGAAHRAGRVLVALTTGSREASPLELYLQLLDEVPQQLLGLLLEDSDVLALARSQLAREIVLSGLERPLDPVRLERQLRAQSAGVRRSFERHAARLGVEFRFEIVRGEPLSELRRAAETADALVVDVAARGGAALDTWPHRNLRQLAETPLRRVVFTRQGWDAGTEVVAVVDAAELAAEPAGATNSTLDAARRIAMRMRCALRVVVLARDDAAAAALRPAAIERTARVGGVRFAGLTVLRGAAPEAEAAAAARNARVIVLTARQAATSALVTELIVHARGALLLVREI
jgi:hypothetical protein